MMAKELMVAIVAAGILAGTASAQVSGSYLVGENPEQTRQEKPSLVEVVTGHLALSFRVLASSSTGEHKTEDKPAHAARECSEEKDKDETTAAAPDSEEETSSRGPEPIYFGF